MDCPIIKTLEITTTARLKRVQINGGYQFTDIVPAQVIDIPSPSFSQGQLRLDPLVVDMPLGVVTSVFLTSPSFFTVKLGDRKEIVTNTFSYNGEPEILTISNPNSTVICVQHVVVLAQGLV